MLAQSFNHSISPLPTSVMSRYSPYPISVREQQSDEDWRLARLIRRAQRIVETARTEPFDLNLAVGSSSSDTDSDDYGGGGGKAEGSKGKAKNTKGKAKDTMFATTTFCVCSTHDSDRWILIVLLHATCHHATHTYMHTHASSLPPRAAWHLFVDDRVEESTFHRNRRRASVHHCHVRVCTFIVQPQHQAQVTNIMF